MAEVDGSMRTRKKPVGVSLMVTYGFAGVSVVVPDPDFGVGVGVPETGADGVADGLVSGVTPPFADKASFMDAISLYPVVSFTFMVRVRNPGDVTVSV